MWHFPENKQKGAKLFLKLILSWPLRDRNTCLAYTGKLHPREENFSWCLSHLSVNFFYSHHQATEGKTPVNNGRKFFKNFWKAQQLIQVFLPGKYHGQRSQAGYSPWGHKELDMTEMTWHWSTSISSIIDTVNVFLIFKITLRMWLLFDSWSYSLSRSPTMSAQFSFQFSSNLPRTTWFLFSKNSFWIIVETILLMPGWMIP